MKIAGIIPARYGSTRLPGKPLRDICGKPMIWWVYERVKECEKLTEIYVATDDERINLECKKFNIPVVMTKKEHQTAAHRLQEVSQKIDADFYVQLNGDEPLINKDTIDAVIPEEIVTDVEFGTNIITKISNPVEVNDPSNIKVVFDHNNNARYMSRTPIPYPFKSIDYCYYKHVGIIGYNKKMLDFYATSQPGALEKIEGIDTMRFIDYSKQLKFILVDKCNTLSVDTQKDLDKVIEIISKEMKG